MSNDGLSTFGIVRKRMADLFSDFATRIKENGAFGSQTTLDDPDNYAGDPLVAIASAASASTHELWEAVEFYYNQLDPNSAEGQFLQRLHADRFGINGTSMSDEQLRSAVLTAAKTGVAMVTPTSLALADPAAKCAQLVLSKPNAPVPGLPAPGAMLVVNGNIDYDNLAQQLWERTDIGLYDWYGDTEAQVTTPNGGCITYRFQPACRVYIGVEVFGFTDTTACDDLDPSTVATSVLAALEAAYDGCEFGSRITNNRLRQILEAVDGFTFTGVRVKRIPKYLTCDINSDEYGEIPTVTIDGTPTVWSTDLACGFCAGDLMGCEDEYGLCVQLEPWEFADFELQFIEVTEVDASEEGC